MYRIVYSSVFYLVMPLVLIRLLIRSRKAANYRRRISERFALTAMPQNFDKSRQTIWIHSVSVGETVAAAPLVRQLQEKYPQIQLFITTMTPTGSDRVRDLFGENVFHTYIPYDLPGATARLMRKIQPTLLILMETELWPNLIHHCHKSAVRIVLANARLSEKSAQAYRKYSKISAEMLGKIDCIVAQAEADADRFMDLGVEKSRIRVGGSLKFNIDVKPQQEQSAWFTTMQDAHRRVVIAASTREGEEVKLLAAFELCLEVYPDLILLLVPRHPERFDKVARLCENKGFRIDKRSKNLEVESQAQILIGDSMGEMLSYYSLAEIAFVGGSLVDTGCQNVLEPAALGIPVVTGPSQFNFATICAQLESVGALKTVANELELADFLLQLLSDKALQQQMGEKGRKMIEENQNALPNLMETLEPLIEETIGSSEEKQG